MLFLISSIAIPLFYGAGLMYGQRSPLITAEYWRWWVVHLWVEGFFEVFATVVIAFLLTRLRLLSIATATRGVLFSTIIYLSGGIIGTFHHADFAKGGNQDLIPKRVSVEETKGVSAASRPQSCTHPGPIYGESRLHSPHVA